MHVCVHIHMHTGVLTSVCELRLVSDAFLSYFSVLHLGTGSVTEPRVCPLIRLTGQRAPEPLLSQPLQHCNDRSHRYVQLFNLGAGDQT